MSNIYTKEEVLKLDKELRGKLYQSTKNKDYYFLHCVVQDLDTKVVNVILSNTFTNTMSSYTYENFTKLVDSGSFGKITLEPRFKPVTKDTINTSSKKIEFAVESSDATKRIHEYDERDKQKQIKSQGFAPE